MKLLACLSILLSSSVTFASSMFASSAVGRQPANEVPVSVAVAEVMAEWDTQASPGCAVAVIDNQEIVFKRGYGLANLDYGLPITSRTVFDIGSVSKQFTAAAIALLAQRGKLALDDDIRTHLPEMPDYGTPITIQHLIHHTSGVRDYLTLMLLAGLDSHDSYTLDEIVQLIASQKNLNFEPGSEHLYSNSGYMLLAEIVERLSEQPFGQFAKENFFGPLEMHDSFVYEDRGRIVPRRATGYSPAEEGSFAVDHVYNFTLPGDGQVYTTVEDMARWDLVFYEGSSAAKAVGGDDFVRSLLQVEPLSGGQPNNYAFGLVHGTYRGLATVSHGGAWGGFRAEFLRFPTESMSFVTLCNLGDTDPAAITRRIAGIFLADRMESEDAADSPGTDPSSDTKNLELSPTQLQRYAGTYFFEQQKQVRVVNVKDGKLFYTRAIGSETELSPLASDRFRLDGSGPVVVFQSRDGQIDGLCVELPTGSDCAIRKQRLDDDAASLEPFAGRFVSAELGGVVYQIEAKDGTLVVTTPGETLLFEQAFADFFVDQQYGFLGLEWQRDGSGRPTRFLAHAGRVRDIGFVRAEQKRP